MPRMQRILKRIVALLILCVVIFTVTVNYLIESVGELQRFNNINREKVTIASVCCGGREEVEEALAMVKSAIIFSGGLKLHLIMFVDNHTLYPMGARLRSLVPEAKKWNVYLHYDLRKIAFPPAENSSEWYNLFQPCAAQRLFLPSRLPDVDALLYLDTDTLIVSDTRSIWGHFQNMNSSQMVAMSPEHESPADGWYNRFAMHPFYPPLGVNSGVMLMNLTRLREFGWEDKVIAYYKKYKQNLFFGGQDIINIIFHFYPGQLYVFSCAYNYRSDHCVNDSNCKAAESEGIYVIHGNGGNFQEYEVIPFHTVYKFFDNFELSSNNLQQDLINPIKKLHSLKESNCSNAISAYVFKS